jgi:hypothetical protein
MRIVMTSPDRATDPQTLWRELSSRPGGPSATPDLVKAFNPHLNFDQPLAAGSVLLIPDAADLKAGAGTAVGGDVLNEVFADVNAGLTATRKRVRDGFAQLEADHAAVASALKSAPSKRLVDSDPLLKKQLQSVDAQFKADQKRATETESQLAEAQKLAIQEFGRLRKLLTG